MKNEIQSELNKIDPSFSQEKINPPYTVPKGYFDDLSFRIMENVSQSKTRPSLTKRIFTFRHSWSIAASVLIVLGSWYVFTMKNGPTEISSEDAIVYIENNIDDFDEYSLAELASLSDLTETSTLNLSEEIFDQIIGELDEDEIEELF